MTAWKFSTRQFALLLSCFLVIFAAAGIVSHYGVQGNPWLERFLCRFGLCNDDALRDSGYQLLSQGDKASIAAAVETFRESVRRDPASTYRWCTLAEALLAAGQRDEARQCIERALVLGPNMGQILMRAAAFYFEVDQKKEALHCMSSLLSKTSDFDASIFSAYARHSVGIDNILNDGLPPLERPGQAHFRFMMSQESTTADDARKAWQRLVAHQWTSDKLAGEYVDFLLKKHEYDAACDAWLMQLANRAGDYPRANVLFNGDFEMEPTGGVLDWRITKVGDVEVSRDSGTVRQGGWSLRVRFAGNENLAFGHVTQRSVVEPGSYRFEGWIKTEEITTDQGLGWRIFDPESSARLDVNFDNRIGTVEWTKQEKVISVPPQTRLLEIQLLRRQTLKFDNKIAGTVWIDGLRLEPIRLSSNAH